MVVNRWQRSNEGSICEAPITTGKAQPARNMSVSKTKAPNVNGTSQVEFRSLEDSSPQKSDLTTFATPATDVSAFSQAVMSNLVPKDFWGHGQEGENNRKLIMKNIDIFVQSRRFESISLHTVSQGIKVSFQVCAE